MTGNSSHAPGGWIVHYSSQHHSALVVFRGRNPPQPTAGWKKPGGGHFQRLKNMSIGILIDGQCRDPLYQVTQNDVVDIAIEIS
jgi:hypothetical protein